MGGPGETVDAAVLAALVRIDGAVERNVGGGIAGDQAHRFVGHELGLAPVRLQPVADLHRLLLHVARLGLGVLVDFARAREVAAALVAEGASAFVALLLVGAGLVITVHLYSIMPHWRSLD